MSYTNYINIQDVANLQCGNGGRESERETEVMGQIVNLASNNFLFEKQHKNRKHFFVIFEVLF